MLRVTIKLPPEQTDLKKAVAEKLRVPESAFTLTPRKRSVDARKVPVFVWTADLTFADRKTEAALLRRFGNFLERAEVPAPYRFPAPSHFPKQRPVVVGFGPAGIFCALMLARSGFAPIVLERGGDVDERTAKVEAFCKTGTLDPECNVQFGEGGAGAFSDGKLNSLVKEKSYRGTFVLEQFVKAGAPEEILWLNKPHVGTDVLRSVIKTMREEILRRGGEVRFHTKLTGFLTENGAITGVRTESGETIPTDTVVLAVGHSARDTFALLHDTGVPMEKKPFSVGVRIEHKQRMIDASQYGKAADKFPPADYKLVCHTENGRTVYTFCMCPGGVVMAAASDEDGVVTNGMSYHARDGENANAALLCEVRPEDLEDDLLSGVRFQKELEKAAFRLGGGNHKAPAQTVGDYLAHRKTTAFGSVRPTYPRGVTGSDLHELLPGFVSVAFEDALPKLGRMLAGYDSPDAVLTGVESRTTSPVRVLRGETLQSDLRGLYPCGEGAGYAGGILSAAIDGIKVAEQIVTK
ncbi:MAG: FAD-dependent oxidoreductase [Clostridiales bacterium]|nr:FAD-dependent oxidoreductase [Candidatus Coliplasma caballi]